MGYACPVCGDPQADAGHLANHLAITAVARGGDHEAWLDEHVPDWGERGEAELADAVATMADDADYPQVFEDTTGDRPEHDHDQGHNHAQHHSTGREHAADIPVDVADPTVGNGGDLDAATREAIQNARELLADADDADDAADTPDGAGAEQSESETE